MFCFCPPNQFILFVILMFIILWSQYIIINKRKLIWFYLTNKNLKNSQKVFIMHWNVLKLFEQKTTKLFEIFLVHWWSVWVILQSVLWQVQQIERNNLGRDGWALTFKTCNWSVSPILASDWLILIALKGTIWKEMGLTLNKYVFWIKTCQKVWDLTPSLQL